jgi:hypothetical protein
MQQNNEENTETLEEARENTELKRVVSQRVSYITNALRLPVSAGTSSRAILNYLKTTRSNPKSSQYDVLKRLSKQHRDAVTMVGGVVPISAIVNASDNQIKKIVRDVATTSKKSVKKLNEELLNEEFQPPAMLILKRQAIRQFPNAQRVAMYTDNKYGLSFTVPYDAMGRGFTSVNYAGMPSTGIAPTSARLNEGIVKQQNKQSKGNFLRQLGAHAYIKGLSNNDPSIKRVGREVTQNPDISSEKTAALYRNLPDMKTPQSLRDDHAAMHLQEEGDYSILTFTTGEEVYLDQNTINSLQNVFESLSQENQDKMVDMLLENADTFNRIIQFVELIKDE